MTKKIAILILNYQTGEMTDALCNYYKEHDSYPNKYKDIYVINNGPDDTCKTANIQFENNLYFTNGFYEAYKIVSKKKRYDAFYFVCSDVGHEYGNDVTKNLVKVLFSDKEFGQIHAKCKSPHEVMYKMPNDTTNSSAPFIEFVAPMIKASTIKKVGFWDTNFSYGWGMDFDYGYRVRGAGLKNVVTSLGQISQQGNVSTDKIDGYREKASSQMNEVMTRKYGGGWHPMIMSPNYYTKDELPNKILPAVMTCSNDMQETRRFVETYNQSLGIMENVLRPLVSIDITSNNTVDLEHKNLMDTMTPYKIIIHEREYGYTNQQGVYTEFDITQDSEGQPSADSVWHKYNSVQQGTNFLLEHALKYAKKEKAHYVLFLEDDIEISNRINEVLSDPKVEADCGFLSLYGPANSWPWVIPVNSFYGTQAILFPIKSLEHMMNHRDEMMGYRPGYDIRWSRFLRDKGYQMYCTDPHYVQHIQGASRLHQGVSSVHTSNKFIGWG